MTLCFYSQAAKNLMNAVVLTVKASYVASTKYRKHHQNDQAIVTWKMKVGARSALRKAYSGGCYTWFFWFFAMIDSAYTKFWERI